MLENACHVEPMNPETTYAIGRSYQVKAFGSESNDPDALARKAIEWYQRGMKLNPHDGYNWLSWGMCLDRIGSSQDPRPDTSLYYRRAEELDPNGYYTAANIGWHYFETGDYAAARSWLQRSGRLEWVENEIVTDMLPLVERRLKEDAGRNR
jgi:Flp pilus assembly protein TadD